MMLAVECPIAKYAPKQTKKGYLLQQNVITPKQLTKLLKKSILPALTCPQNCEQDLKIEQSMTHVLV